MPVPVGDRAPVFTLPDENGELLTLPQAALVLVFYRGDW